MLAVVVAALLPLLSYALSSMRSAVHRWWGAGEWSSAGEWLPGPLLAPPRGTANSAASRPPTPSTTVFQRSGRSEPPLLVIGLLGIARQDASRPSSSIPTLLIYLAFDWMYRCGNWYRHPAAYPH
ncbi:MAG: hypothetical protein H6643_08445 [Caldilineaceae bacterium]|nr:hypothetical protein [Caldilineaceae bacterium]